MSSRSFDDLVKTSMNRTPLSRQVIADLETPLSIYLKLANCTNSYLFESVQGGEKWGRYSLIGLYSPTVLTVVGSRLEVTRGSALVAQCETSDPLSEIERFRAVFSLEDLPNLPRFTGGLVGYFGYDTVRYVEPSMGQNVPIDALKTPDILLMASDEVAIFDNLSGKITLVVHCETGNNKSRQQAEKRLDILQNGLARPIEQLPQLELSPRMTADFISSFGRDQYMDSVDQVKNYILAGDVMQVVLSQRLSAPFQSVPINLYRALRVANPSPYMYYLDLGSFQIVGSSPEVLARFEDGSVTVRPIAGTRRRGLTEHEDKLLEAEMLSDPKELAEHLMLIDLGRNDVGRISKAGTVCLTDKMAVERYSHVMHMTSNIQGQTEYGIGPMDVLRATLPAGTLSGAPKIRAMQIIDELEPVKRNIYGGAIGYIGWNGNMDTAIAIRTAVIKEGVVHVQAGGGVVIDSDPASEWDETMNKARALIEAAAIAAGTATR
ncbi:MAG: anthranilate synthase component I [Cellvibrionales bacterium TMED148]|nr:anthranilate synthase component I [Porticoccaceae bacterium]RPG88351.1 MAG: anthranilate synthase component I [Cellvibrionales bacterium TMED148]